MRFVSFRDHFSSVDGSPAWKAWKNIIIFFTKAEAAISDHFHREKIKIARHASPSLRLHKNLEYITHTHTYTYTYTYVQCEEESFEKGGLENQPMRAALGILTLSLPIFLSHTNTLDWVRQHHSYRKEIAFSACVREREREWITCVCVERECEWENCVYLYLCVCGGGRWTACQLSTSLLGLPLHMTTTTMTATTHGRSKISKEEFFWGGLFVVVLCYISMRSHYRGSERANTLQRLPMFRLASQALCNRKILKMDQTRPLFVCIRFSLDK